jgi:putative transposase
MIDRAHPTLPVTRQCRILNVSRATVYRRPAAVSDADLELMALIDRQYLARPFYGSRRMAAWLNTQGHAVNRKRVQRLMRLMGLVAICQRPNTSKAASEQVKYPYLLGGMTIDRVNQVWCSDITYIPMPRGFLYLVVIMDWHSRAVLSWRLSNTLHADFCVEALEEALRQFGRPDIFNTDQGSQFTSDDFIGVLKRSQIKISMDGKGRRLPQVSQVNPTWSLGDFRRRRQGFPRLPAEAKRRLVSRRGQKSPLFLAPAINRQAPRGSHLGHLGKP